MNIKKFALSVTVLVILLGVFTLSASAAPDWYSCDVKSLGAGFDTIYVELVDSNGLFTRRWFIPPVGSENKVLAIALAAQANNQKVLIYADPNAASNERFLYAFYIWTE